MNVDVSNITHRLNKLFMGCHFDTGYVHASRGLRAQMISDESFEAEQIPGGKTNFWPTFATPNATGVDIHIDDSVSMNGFKSMRISVVSGVAGVFNL